MNEEAIRQDPEALKYSPESVHLLIPGAIEGAIAKDPSVFKYLTDDFQDKNERLVTKGLAGDLGNVRFLSQKSRENNQDLVELAFQKKAEYIVYAGADFQKKHRKDVKDAILAVPQNIRHFSHEAQRELKMDYHYKVLITPSKRGFKANFSRTKKNKGLHWKETEQGD